MVQGSEFLSSSRIKMALLAFFKLPMELARAQEIGTSGFQFLDQFIKTSSSHLEDSLKASSLDIWMHRCRLFCDNQGIYRDEYIKVKALRRSSSIIIRKSVLRCYKVEFPFFLSGFSFANIHDSQDSMGRGDYLFMIYLICLVSVMICIFNGEKFIYGTFEDCVGLCNSPYCSSYFRISTR